ncbi:MAG: hypothetical protein ACFFCQ_11380 [Promethearchaeota archaeon]
MTTELPPGITHEKLESLVRRDQGGAIIGDVKILSVQPDEIRAVCYEFFKEEIASVNVVNYFLSPEHWKIIASNQATENEQGESIWYDESTTIYIEDKDEAMKLSQFLQSTFSI